MRETCGFERCLLKFSYINLINNLKVKVILDYKDIFWVTIKK